MTALVTSGEFDVSLHLVVLWTDYDDDGTENYVYRCDIVDSEVNSGDITVFHIPRTSSFQEISSRNYIQRTGNEPMEAQHRYFAGGMFVRPKHKNGAEL